MPVAIAAVETSSIAQGTVVGDAMLKTADVELIEASTLSPGKYWVLIGGAVAPVRAALERGRAVAADTLLDHLLIPALHEGVLPALRGIAPRSDDDALGVIETHTAAAAVLAADTAVKAARVVIRDLRLANGIGGKGVVFVSGAVSDVQAAVAAGRAPAESRGLLARAVVIPRLHPGMRGRVLS